MFITMATIMDIINSHINTNSNTNINIKDPIWTIITSQELVRTIRVWGTLLWSVLVVLCLVENAHLNQSLVALVRCYDFALCYRKIKRGINAMCLSSVSVSNERSICQFRCYVCFCVLQRFVFYRSPSAAIVSWQNRGFMRRIKPYFKTGQNYKFAHISAHQEVLCVHVYATDYNGMRRTSRNNSLGAETDIYCNTQELHYFIPSTVYGAICYFYPSRGF